MRGVVSHSRDLFGLRSATQHILVESDFDFTVLESCDSVGKKIRAHAGSPCVRGTRRARGALGSAPVVLEPIAHESKECSSPSPEYSVLGTVDPVHHLAAPLNRTSNGSFVFGVVADLFAAFCCVFLAKAVTVLSCRDCVGGASLV